MTWGSHLPPSSTSSTRASAPRRRPFSSKRASITRPRSSLRPSASSCHATDTSLPRAATVGNISATAPGALSLTRSGLMKALAVVAAHRHEDIREPGALLVPDRVHVASVRGDPWCVLGHRTPFLLATHPRAAREGGGRGARRVRTGAWPGRLEPSRRPTRCSRGSRFGTGRRRGNPGRAARSGA